MENEAQELAFFKRWAELDRFQCSQRTKDLGAFLSCLAPVEFALLLQMFSQTQIEGRQGEDGSALRRNSDGRMSSKEPVSAAFADFAFFAITAAAIRFQNAHLEALVALLCHVLKDFVQFEADAGEIAIIKWRSILHVFHAELGADLVGEPDQVLPRRHLVNIPAEALVDDILRPDVGERFVRNKLENLAISLGTRCEGELRVQKERVRQRDG